MLGFLNNNLAQEVEVEVHLIDSMILTKIFNVIMDMKGDFEVTLARAGGTAQAVGIVSDVRTLLPLLANELEMLGSNR